MIISASYKTDIPTYYGEWFSNRLRAGYCKTVNPYNKQVIQVSLRPEDVDGIVFWTKNVGPFLKYLPEVKARKIPFIVQHTITGYPRPLEQAVVEPGKSVENVRRIAEIFGPRVCVWRYDTIVLSSLTPRALHLETFARLAQDLEGATDEVVVSFAHIYKKTLRNMSWAARKFGFSWNDPDTEYKQSLLVELAEIAANHRMKLTLCSQPQFLVENCGEARCIDKERLEAIVGKPINVKEKGNRPECRCAQARDIGEYDTCPQGCVYCYAVQDRTLAQQRLKQHDPQGEFLFPPANETQVQATATANRPEPTLFDSLPKE